MLEPLREFLDAHELGSGELSAQPIGEGHSNVTYLIERADGSELVLRRPPRPPLPPSAHDVVREARLLRALKGTAGARPGGARGRRGRGDHRQPVLRDGEDRGRADRVQRARRARQPAERERIAQELIEALVEIHAVDWRAVGLEGFGKPTGYLERQLRRFSGLWEINKTREIPAVDARDASGWRAHIPESGPATIVHGDYRLGNTMYAPDAPAHLAAVLDWEMATIGDPLADLGYLCMMWSEPGDPPGGLRDALGRVTRAEGFPTRAELIARYEELSGRSMRELRWYVTLAVWKSVVFMEGNYKRAQAGMTDDPYLVHFGEGVLQLAAHAEEVALGERFEP